MTNKKYYWLKLDRNFFKRHDIRVIESMDNGKDYVLFYLKLLVESIDHEGQLRFSETIPYDEKMLATITNMNIDIVRSAIKIFTELHLMEVFDDKTIYLFETQKMLGEATSTHRVKAFRERQKQLQIIEERNVNETLHKRKSETHIEIEKEIEKDLKEKDKKEKTVAKRSPSFIKPTREEIFNYCKERKNNIDPSQFYDFYEAKNWMIGKNKMKDWKAAVRTWEQRDNNSTLKKSSRPDVKPDWLDGYIEEQGGI